jgi:hypothetical protein
MTHAIYTAQQLQLKSIARLKQIYSEIFTNYENIWLLLRYAMEA